MRQVDSVLCGLILLCGLLLAACSDGDAVTVDGDGGDYDAWDGNREDGDVDDEVEIEDDSDPWERFVEGDYTNDTTADVAFAEWRSEAFSGENAPQNVTRILPWANGGAYIGAQNGLFRYDPSKAEGERLYAVPKPDGIDSFSVLDMTIGSEGALFLIFQSPETTAALMRMRYDDELRVMTGCELNHAATTITAMGESQWVYIGTSGPVYFFNGTGCTTDLTTDWPQGGIRAMRGTSDGRMAILQYRSTIDFDGYILNLLDNQWFTWTVDDGLTDADKLTSLFAVDYAELPNVRDFWLGHSAGLQQINSRRELESYGGAICTGANKTDCGLPTDDVRQVALDNSGGLWAATGRGVIYRPAEGEAFKLFQSRRYLADNEPSAIGFDAEGDIWVGHADGVSHLYRQQWTLKDKSDHLIAGLQARHLRMEGFAADCSLAVSGDLESCSVMLHADDAMRTALYALTQIFRSQAAKGESERVEAAQHAKKAVEMLAEMIRATTYEEIPEIDGLPARSILPRGEGPLENPEAGEWNRSDHYDWLGDPGPQELLAHVLVYPLYVELLASDAEKKTLTATLKRLADHVISHNWKFVDVDGAPTELGDWTSEAIGGATGQVGYGGVRALELLALLRATYALTGDETYFDAYIERAIDAGYADATRHQKTMSAARQADHAADKQAFLASFALLKQADLVRLRDVYMASIAEAWQSNKPEKNALFDLIYGVYIHNDFGLDDVVASLRTMPTDRVDWRIDSCWRMDLAHQDDSAEPPLLAKLLPFDEQMLLGIGDNPYACQWSSADDPDLSGGRTEDDGIAFLLPYWLARYHHMIAPPAK